MKHFPLFAALIFSACTATPETEDEQILPNAHANYVQKKPTTQQSESDWDIQNGFRGPVNEHGIGVRDPEYKVFGWNPYAEGTAYLDYNFDLLWGIAYFSYDVDPYTGNYKSIHSWKSTPMIDTAQAHGCEVYLSVSNFGGSNNHTLLNSAKSTKTLIENLIGLLKLRKANGVNIDFEGIEGRDREAFTTFIKQLSRRLKAENSDYKVSIALYAVDYNSVFDIPKLNPGVDFYTLMAYDYHGGFSKVAGPIAPLKSSSTWGPYSVENSVNSYLEKGVDKKKLIVGLPYYGGAWMTESNKIPGKSVKFLDNPGYSAIIERLASAGVTPELNKTSASMYAIIQSSEGTEQIWFEGEESLQIKYNWIKSQKLGGVSFWALGFDKGKPDLWKLLLKSFGKAPGE